MMISFPIFPPPSPSPYSLPPLLLLLLVCFVCINIQGYKVTFNLLHTVKSVKLLGIWLSDTMDWELNTMESCKKAYANPLHNLCDKYISLNSDLM